MQMDVKLLKCLKRSVKYPTLPHLFIYHSWYVRPEADCGSIRIPATEICRRRHRRRLTVTISMGGGIDWGSSMHFPANFSGLFEARRRDDRGDPDVVLFDDASSSPSPPHPLLFPNVIQLHKLSPPKTLFLQPSKRRDANPNIFNPIWIFVASILFDSFFGVFYFLFFIFYIQFVIFAVGRLVPKYLRSIRWCWGRPRGGAAEVSPRRRRLDAIDQSAPDLTIPNWDQNLEQLGQNLTKNWLKMRQKLVWKFGLKKFGLKLAKNQSKFGWKMCLKTDWKLVKIWLWTHQKLKM